MNYLRTRKLVGTTLNILLVSLLGNAQILAQQIQVKTLSKNINASGGVTVDKFGNVYVSDFGKKLGAFDSLTNVYRWDIRTGKISVFASGFKGASGACFDQEGNFYQSNPFGHSISKVSTNGEVNHKWAVDGLKTPVGLEADNDGNIFVCNCGRNEIGRISKTGRYQTFASSELFKCPNGLTQDNSGNLYACNFGDGKVLKIDKQGETTLVVELPSMKGGPNPVGNGHVVWKKGWLYVTTIGTGEIYRVGLDGKILKIAGKAFAFSNIDGNAEEATFNKPNGIEASITGDTLYINVSDPTWVNDPAGLHPAHLRAVTGISSIVKAREN